MSRPRLSRIMVFPIKSLDPMLVDGIGVANGGLAVDRQYAMFDRDGEYVNGRSDDRVHRLRAEYDRSPLAVTLSDPDDDRRARFVLDDERDELGAWLSEYFGEPITVDASSDTNFNDGAGGLSFKSIATPGPTVISTASLEVVASWFDGLSVDDLRLRLRTNLEIDGVPAFWEDRLYADRDNVVEFRIGDTTIDGVYPKPRCVVPTRDPETGEVYDGFVSRFSEKREETFPDWADPADFTAHIEYAAEHYYYLGVGTRIPASEMGDELSVGDRVEIVGEKPILRSL